MAKTNWQYNEIVKPEDMNAMGQEINEALQKARGAIPATEKGQANGVAKLDANGKVLDGSGNVIDGQVRSINGRKGDVTINANDVGLANVQNYGVASQAEAEAGTANNKYMTPLRTKQLVDKFAETPAGAQAKANQAEANAKAASVAKTGDSMTGDLAINGLKTKNLNGSTAASVKWYKVARIQMRNPIDQGESSTFTGMLFVQRDYGVTAYNTVGQVNFSFGTRGGTIKPIIFSTGDGTALTDNKSYKFRIYKDADGWHFLYFMRPTYSRFASFIYRSDGCTEYWIEEDPTAVPGLTLVWDSDNGEVQDVYVGKKRVWHEGNDGPGSGLDADTIDGKHFSDIQADAQAKADNAETRAKNYFMGAGIGVQAIWYDISLINGVQPYDAGTAPRFCKIGNIVFLIGAVKNITAPVTIGYLPEGYRPKVLSHFFIQNTSMISNTQATLARWVIGTDGAIRIEGIGGGAQFGTDKWFPISTCFVADLTFG